MAGIVKNLLNVSVIALTIPMVAFGAQKDNPRGTVIRGETTYTQGTDDNTSVKDSATSVIARSVTSNAKRTNAVSRSATPAQSTAKARTTGTSDATKSRAAATVRSATPARAAAVTDKQTGSASRANTSRAATNRAPLFNDVSKISGGFADCRDAYATCMDQFCGLANDTYGRCFCSDKFATYREMDNKLDTALSMLASFEDNNLAMVDKTAAEVNAMYSSSEGESAIKKDTSASQKLLNSINDILNGKITVAEKKTSLVSLGVLDFSGFDTDNDIFGGSSSIFGGDSYESLADLEGKELYNKAHKQCEEIIRDSCKNDATFNLARSSYSIMINQDCNLYEKKGINVKRASLDETIRKAEKYLREARLEEYRAHNSTDVIACLTDVEAAARSSVVCGENYEKCMDPTGMYVERETGKPVPGPQFFGLNSLIVLDGSMDVLKANSQYDKWLDGTIKEKLSKPLDSCRSISDTVWREFKRSTLIRVSQAQDNLVKQVKDSCLNTIKECYNVKSETIEDMDISEGQYAGGVGAWLTRGACYEEVLACAALYGDQDGCKYDDRSKKITAVSGKTCGLQSLLAYVDTIDAVRVAEGCETGLRKQAHEICDPKVSNTNAVYPMGCANVSRAALKQQLDKYKDVYCPVEAFQSDTSNVLSANSVFNNSQLVDQVVNDIYAELQIAMIKACEEDDTIKGTWVSERPNASKLSVEFYKKYFSKTSAISTYGTDEVQALSTTEEDGWCIMGAEQQYCVDLGSTYASWDSTSGTCVLTYEWYQNRCSMLSGSWDGTYCTVGNVTYTMDTIP